MFFLFFLGLGILLAPDSRPQAGLKTCRPKAEGKTSIPERIVKRINQERAAADVPPVELDDLATTVATVHAREMAELAYAGHWSPDGKKPYMRYSFAGGTEAVAENVAGIFGVVNTLEEADLVEYLADLHLSMYEEKPPHDGHRKTILRAEHTHVGIGFALINGSLCYAEEYLSRYVEVSPLPVEAKRKTALPLTGKILNPQLKLSQIEIFFEPLPTPPAIAWLRAPRNYGLPATRVGLATREKAGTNVETGAVTMTTPTEFRTTLKLNRDEPGIYTVVVWLTDPSGKISREAFPVTNQCIRAS
ncbi:MAG: CAP domain-containing protein [Blastocatellia bacterium]|nr:CAP domain-containing protein [Blastocatellia bacterium]